MVLGISKALSMDDLMTVRIPLHIKLMVSYLLVVGLVMNAVRALIVRAALAPARTALPTADFEKPVSAAIARICLPFFPRGMADLAPYLLAFTVGALIPRRQGAAERR